MSCFYQKLSNPCLKVFLLICRGLSTENFCFYYNVYHLSWRCLGSSIVFQFYSTASECEFISETRKVFAINCCYSLITLNRSLLKISLKWEYNAWYGFKDTVKWNMESLVFSKPFEIIRTRWNSSAHQGNQNHNGEISMAVPATFKIHRTRYACLFN